MLMQYDCILSQHSETHTASACQAAWMPNARRQATPILVTPALHASNESFGIDYGPLTIVALAGDDVDDVVELVKEMRRDRMAR